MTSQGSHGRRALLSMTALPIVFTVSGIAAIAAMPPVARLYPDPSYAYLLNGLSVTLGTGTGHTDHPGTSLQWFTGLMELLIHWSTGVGQVLTDDVVARPEHYLSIIATVLVLGQGAALWYLGVRFLRAMGTGAALLAQTGVVATIALVPFRLYVIPEAFLLVWAMVLLALVAPRLVAPSASSRWQHTVPVGVVMAVGITGKVIFAPFVLLPLALYRLRALGQIYLAFLGATVVIMWVARDRLDAMVEWFRAVSTTSTRYPGEAEIRTVAEGFATVPGALVGHYPVFVLGAVLTIAGTIAHLTRRPRLPRAPLVRALIALGVASLGTLAMTYKVYRVNDLVLLSVLGGVLAAYGWYLLAPAREAPSRWLIPPIAAAVIAGIVNVTGTTMWVRSVSGESDYTRLLAYLESKAATGSRVAVGYGIFNEATALYFGNQWANNVVQSQTMAAHPGWMEYRIWNGDIYTYTESGTSLTACPDLFALAASPGGLLIAPGRPGNPVIPGEQYQGMTVIPEAAFGEQIVYRVENVTCS